MDFDQIDTDNLSFESLGLPEEDLESQIPGMSPPAQLAHQMESFAAATRNLETTLSKERAYARQLRDYSTRLQTQLQEMQRNEALFRAQGTEAQRKAVTMGVQLKQYGTELARLKRENEQYRQAWSQVQAREKDARALMGDYAEIQKRAAELEVHLKTLQPAYAAEKKRREEVESHVKKYRTELHTALVKQKTFEASNNTLQADVAALQGVTKDYKEEIMQMTRSQQEQIQSGIAGERVKLKAELDKKLIQTTEAIREDERKKVLSHLESRVGQEEARLRATYASRIEEERKRVEESLATVLRQKEETLASLGGSLLSAQGELKRLQQEHGLLRKAAIERETLARKEKDAAAHERNEAILREKRQHEDATIRERDLHEELGAKDKRLAALRAECQLLQEVLIAEKARFKELIDELGQEMIDPLFLDELQNAAEVRIVPSERPGKALSAVPRPARDSRDSMEC